MRKLQILACVCVFAAAACGDNASGKNSVANNTTASNSWINSETNSQTNNGGTNNGSTNNTSTNNGSTNNTSTNNTSTNNGNNSTNNDNQTPVDTFETQFWEAFCEAMFQCENRNTVQASNFFGYRFGTEQECKDSKYRGLVDFEQIELAVDEGRLVFDGNNGQACADAYKDLLCDPSSDGTDLADACEGIYTPQLAEGDDCITDEACIDSTCETIDGECYGVCTAPEDPSACGNETCDLTTEYCGMQGNMMRCQTRKEAGETCDSDGECVDGVGCLPAEQGPGTCTELRSLGEGEACGGQPRFCETNFICIGQQTTTCQELTFAGDGESCNFTGGACGAGLVCQDIGFVGGTCEAPRGENEDCQFSYQCSIELYCDGFSFQNPQQPGSCLPRKMNGETCGDSQECDSQFCDIAENAEEGTCAGITYCALP